MILYKKELKIKKPNSLSENYDNFEMQSVYLSQSVRINLYTEVSWVTVVKWNPKALFSIATTLRYREAATLFPGLCHFPLIRTL